MQSNIRRLRIICLPLISLVFGCAPVQTILIAPGQPIRLLASVTVPANQTAREVSPNQWIVNSSSVALPAGAYVVVLPATTQP